MKALVCDVCNRTIRKDSGEKSYILLVRERDWFDDRLKESSYGHIDICEDCLEHLLNKESNKNVEERDQLVKKLEDLSNFVRERFNVEDESTNMR